MTTVAQLAASGSGRVAFILEITGYPYCFSTIPGWTPSDSWYTTAGYDGVYDWLQPVGIDTEELSRFIEGILEVPSLELTVLDYDGLKTAMLKDCMARTSSRLASSLTASGTTITLFSAASFPSSGRAWLGLEAVSYTGKTATQLTGVTRAKLGTVARAYTVNHTIEPPVGIMVTDGPVDIRGRPARVHMAVLDDDGTPGATTCIFRGFVGTEVEIGEGVWRIPLEHAWSVVSERNIGQGMPSSPVVRGYSYGGTSMPGLSTITLVNYNRVTQWPYVYEITIDAGHYTAQELIDEINSEISSSSASLKPVVIWSEDDGSKTSIRADDDTTWDVRFLIREGDPLWALGWSAGEIRQDPGVALEREADDPPKHCVVDMSMETRALDNAIVEVEDGARFVDDLYVQLGKGPYARIHSISSNTIELWYQDPVRGKPFWAIDHDDREDAVLRHVFVFPPALTTAFGLSTAMKRALHLLSGQDEPDTWCAFGLEDDDIDWTELTTAMAGAPTALTLFVDCVTEPVSFAELFSARLGLLGIAPRITSDAKVGFARIETPIPLAASSVEVDSDMWSGMDAARVRVQLGGEGMVSQALCKFGYDYTTEKWARPIEVTWDDGIAERGRVRSISYDLRGLIIHDKIPGLTRNRAELVNLIVPWTTALQYGLYGRLAFPLELPCTWTAKQLLAGDVVKVTCPTIPDIRAGDFGVTTELATVTGKKSPHTTDTVDVLHLRFSPSSRASGIAPSAKGTSWDVGTKTLTCAQADTPLYAASGGNDLDEFTAGDDVLIWEWDTATPTGSYPLSATIASVSPSGKTITFTTDPFSGSGLPSSGAVIVTWPAWDDMTAAQQLWLAIADTGYTLGSGSEDGYHWGA